MTKKEAQDILLKFDVRGKVMPDCLKPVIRALIVLTLPTKKETKPSA